MATDVREMSYCCEDVIIITWNEFIMEITVMVKVADVEGGRLASSKAQFKPRRARRRQHLVTAAVIRSAIQQGV